MATPDPYNAAAMGPSQGGLLAKEADLNQFTSSRNNADFASKTFFSNYGFGQEQSNPGGNSQAQLPRLESSLGAAGTYGSGAGNDAISMAKTQHAAQNADITSQFQRAQDDLTRQQAYVAWGIVL